MRGRLDGQNSKHSTPQIKKLSLNMENPVLNGLQVKRQTNNSESSSAMVNGDVSTEEESMDVDDSIGDSSTG